MRILLYNPDNGVTRNFMPHLWMFLLQSLTPAGHEVLLIDGNAQPLDEEGIARYVIEGGIGLVGIGGRAGGRCARRQPSLNSINASRQRPIDLWKLNASARMPGGDLGICCINHPQLNCPRTIAAISQCRTTAVLV